MTISTCHLKDLLIIEPKVFYDDRGYFFESFTLKRFEEQTGKKVKFVQDNESRSTYGTLRGIHFQNPPHDQSKLVRAVTGTILDVAVDLRTDSDTFGQWHSEVLSDENKKQLFIPKGFGHGFAVLSDTAIFSYKVDNYYDQESENGILWNDQSLAIDWQLPSSSIILSTKDESLRSFNEFCLTNVNHQVVSKISTK